MSLLFDTPVNTGDEFVIHTFQSHLTTTVMDYFNTSDPSETIPHTCSFDWLKQLAQTLVHRLLSPSSSPDPGTDPGFFLGF